MLVYKFCCKNCKPPIRHIGCHSTCEKYLSDLEDYNKKVAPLKEHERQERARYEYDFIIQRRIDKIRKKKLYS